MAGADVESRHVKPMRREAEVVNTGTESGKPLTNTQNGEAGVIASRAQSSGNTQQTVALLRILALDQKDIQAGRYREIDTFLAELDSQDKLR
jgi:hypothetical protein